MNSDAEQKIRDLLLQKSLLAGHSEEEANIKIDCVLNMLKSKSANNDEIRVLIQDTLLALSADNHIFNEDVIRRLVLFVLDEQPSKKEELLNIVRRPNTTIKH
ncbi:hypothetical protein L4D76_00495 [Photobacterium sagamiensis]|uniref:hypothetical protein n=1 Tax=Photobacterium sagamiensis TaxID=2910241 RepID=UPI003D14379A